MNKYIVFTIFTTILLCSNVHPFDLNQRRLKKPLIKSVKYVDVGTQTDDLVEAIVIEEELDNYSELWYVL